MFVHDTKRGIEKMRRSSDFTTLLLTLYNTGQINDFNLFLTLLKTIIMGEGVD